MFVYLFCDYLKAYLVAMEESTIDDKDFLYSYQMNHFKEDPKDPFATANLKRKNIGLSLAYSNQRYLRYT